MNELLLVGCGPMSVEYGKVLNAMARSFVVVGRGEASAASFYSQVGITPIVGGLQSFLNSQEWLPETAIVAVGVESLASVTRTLLEHGISNILVEKPGALTLGELEDLNNIANQKNASVLIAYNRRFFASVRKAREIIAEDGGIRSFHFEFTEWTNEIATLVKATGVKENWFLGNSSHVVDLAFHLGGIPTTLHTMVRGSLDWHPAGSIFAGCGETATGVLFSYEANWDAPGRWALEFCTSRHRLVFRPMEKLEVINKGSVKSESIVLDDELDKSYKPGLFAQTAGFLSGSKGLFCNLADQCNMTKHVYYPIAGYSR